MPAGRPEAYMKKPTEADIDDVVETGAAAVDEMIAMQTPSGRYTSPRMKSFTASLVSALSLLQPGFKLDVDVSPAALGQGKNPLAASNRDVPMPAKLVASYIALRQAEDAFLKMGHGELMEDEMISTLPEPIELTTDAKVALAAHAVDALARNKAFRKFAKEMQTMDANKLPAAAKPAGSPGATTDTSQEDAAWDTMWSG